MAKIVRVFRAVEQWCGKEPELGSNSLRDLWEEEHGPSGVPFDPAGAELLIDILDQEFTDRPILLRTVDILELTVSGLVDAVPDGPAASRAPLVVTLSDDSVEHLATRLTAHLAPHPASQEKKPRTRPAAPQKKNKGR